MPGPICLVIVLIPAPRQPWQVPDAPLLDPFLKVQQTGNGEIHTDEFKSKGNRAYLVTVK